MLYDQNFDNLIDYLNDEYTKLCEKTIEDFSEIEYFLEQVNLILRENSLYLSSEDLDSFKNSIEEPEFNEVITYKFPIYKNNNEEEEITPYNLVFSYGKNFDSEIVIDIEVQYEWEDEMEENEEDYFFLDADNED